MEFEKNSPKEVCGHTPDGREIVLALMTPNDVPQLAQEFSEMDPWQRLGMSSEHLARFFATTQSNRQRKVVQVDGQTVGLVVTEYPWLFGVYLKFLGLYRVTQEQGVGTCVIQHLLRQAVAQGVRNYWVCTSLFNKRAVAFYERHGFVKCADLPDLVIEGSDEILFRRKLSARA